ncbi:hypothetical protein PISL3812_02536 [Talaromyces islandicus]|uniref:Uncharacterized protein n=1 Tax=Talaromyces islandicus TaxID=28573 RepID=A0A0U1LQ58_TALIS|nr:hypothetical protein PISL3812_02536 [Talaromyces islandicus]
MNNRTKEEATTARPGPGPQPDQSETKTEKKPANERVSRELCHFLYFEDNDCFFAPRWIDDRKRLPSVDEKMPSDS